MPEILTTYCIGHTPGIVWKLQFTCTGQEVLIKTATAISIREISAHPYAGECELILNNEQKLVALHIKYRAPEEDDGYMHYYFAVSNSAKITEYRDEAC